MGRNPALFARQTSSARQWPRQNQLYRRGKITVLDRPKLEARVCECYAVVEKEFDRLLRNNAAG
jgi:hypothetical protein